MLARSIFHRATPVISFEAMYSLYVFIGLLLLITHHRSICFAQSSQDRESAADICRTAAFLPNAEDRKCASCIRVPNGRCSWCSEPNYDNGNNNFRCDLRENHLKNGCDQKFITSPDPVVLDVSKDEPLRNAGDDGREPVQLQPQDIRLKLRVGETATIKLKFRQAIDYPLDLYYLMDLSWSMKDDKDKLTLLADQLASEMTALTKDFQLGFGSFVDKRIMPFIDPRPVYADQPCVDCVPPYGFRHHTTLTKDTKLFQRLVGEARVSGNLDAPEGGLDALVQVLACTTRIGWRDRSRKTIVFSTDAASHFAGDGRLGGLVEPNDGHCHLDDQGYVEGNHQDYTSIQLLHRLITDAQANVLFAVTSDVQSHYDRLRRALGNDVSAAVGILANDSSNVVELVVNEYNKISQFVTLINSLQGTEGIDLSISASCNNGPYKRINSCGNVRLGDTVTFAVNITLKSCDDHDHSSSRIVRFTIGPSGFAENTRITLEKQCECDCGLNEEFEPNAAECTSRGNLTCGLCLCQSPYAGRSCECDTSEQSSGGKTTSELDYACRRDANPKSPICEGRGYCQCGSCQCQQPQTIGHQIYGKYCECDNFMCPRFGGKICGGNGRCGCDQKCQCYEGWSGVDCSCSTSQDSCRAPNGLICNGKGTCDCGVCTCIDKEYNGRTCEQCETCLPPCVSHRDCALFHGFKSGPYDQSTYRSNCSDQYEFSIVEELPEDHQSRPLLETCQFVDPVDLCTFYFTYMATSMMNDSRILIWIKKEKDCPLMGTPLAITIGIVAGIVLIGLFLLLAWKLLTMWHDRREYDRFQNDLKNAKWATEQNPIFLSPINRYQNPMYDSVRTPLQQQN